MCVRISTGILAPAAYIYIYIDLQNKYIYICVCVSIPNSNLYHSAISLNIIHFYIPLYACMHVCMYVMVCSGMYVTVCM